MPVHPALEAVLTALHIAHNNVKSYEIHGGSEQQVREALVEIRDALFGLAPAVLESLKTDVTQWKTEDFDVLRDAVKSAGQTAQAIGRGLLMSHVNDARVVTAIVVSSELPSTMRFVEMVERRFRR